MSDERKTPEHRATMTDIERLRHSASHVLATAILKLWPEAQFAAGPPVENGFYYDVDLPHRISPEDFEKIEAEMKKEIKANHPFERMEVSRDEALELGKKGRLAAVSSLISAQARTSCARETSARSSSRTWRALIIKATKRIRSCSAFTARHSKRKRNSTITSRCSRKQRSATIASSAKNSNFSFSTTTSGQDFPCFSRAAQSLLTNWRSWRRKPSSPAVINASALRTLRARACTRKAAISPTTPSQCFRRWNSMKLLLNEWNWKSNLTAWPLQWELPVSALQKNLTLSCLTSSSSAMSSKRYNPSERRYQLTFRKW